MRLACMTYRVKDRQAAAKFFTEGLKYRQISDTQIVGVGNCIDLAPPEVKSGYESHRSKLVDLAAGMLDVPNWVSFHAPPRVLILEGNAGSDVEKWVSQGRPGIYSLTYEVFDVSSTVHIWRQSGLASFSTVRPIERDGLTIAYSDPHPITGVVYELINYRDPKFTSDVRSLFHAGY